MARKRPREFNLFLAFAELPEREQKIVSGYIYLRSFMKGCEPEKMSPVELMDVLTRKPGEREAA